MYGFLILLPLTLISLGIGWLIAMSPQVADYIEFATDIPDQANLMKQVWIDRRLWVQIGAHVLAYAVLCFVLMATVRTISAPLPSDRPPLLRSFQLFLEIVFVALPSVVLLWIIGNALRGQGEHWIQWFAVGVLCVGLLISVWITAKRVPLELYNSFAQPHRITKTDIVAVLCVVMIVATAAAFALYPRYSAYLVGMFPVLMLVTAAMFLGIAAIFSRRASPVAVISSLITGVLLLHVIDEVVLPAREFRYRKVALSSGGGEKLSVEQVKAQRKIPDLATAFYQWLDYRRPAIEAYKKLNERYPVFIVSAQGGGLYAAYHPALSLARLTDYCPEFAHHLFGISSVSGGSLGAAVYAELMRSLSPADRGDPASPTVGCSRVGSPTQQNVLNTKTTKFFETDFLSPVIASAFLFDVPSALVPQLRFGRDRARALEFSFEEAWKDLALPGLDSGLLSDFLGRWNPAIPSPALFMSATGVNFGIPVLISQIDWSYNPSFRAVPKPPAAGVGAALEVQKAGLLKKVLDRLDQPDEPLRIGIANILDFRPDVQLATSTAVVLSARYPFVTPPGTIVKSDRIPPEGIFESIGELQLTDGGLYDNSGGIVARELIQDLQKRLMSDDRLKPFRKDIRFHLIRFTDRPAQRQARASKTAYPEIVTPLVTFNAVRLARGVQLARPRTKPNTRISNIYLLDEWYDGTLNWLLSRDTALKIQQRSSWLKGADNQVCCEVQRASSSDKPERMRLTDEEFKELQRADPPLTIEKFVANAKDFEEIFKTLNPDPQPPVATPAPAQVTPAPSPN